MFPWVTGNMFALALFFKFLPCLRTSVALPARAFAVPHVMCDAQKTLKSPQHGREPNVCNGLAKLSAWSDAKNQKRTETKIAH
ncbi:hypothetical protein [Pannonibacter tanglangensis]|uniref:Secreted protein n=1 Tax=Pannonibacter tanglangensis TaxID=2750084 RepID=A0ABW9ZQ41_9HYPH|nr:hypothetical protein [Pannonibacter sp. XCT-34]NBN65177.1 hypothetical protein [Pannonibacter sp. XCT-34]